MHKFMRTVGFSMYQKKQDMDRILRRLAKEGAGTQCLDEKDGGQLCEIRAEAAPGMGVVIMATGLPSMAGAWSSSSTFAPPKRVGLPLLSI